MGKTQKIKRKVTSSTIAKMLKQGRSSGSKVNYQPLLKIRDVSGGGNHHRIKGWKTNRVHHLLNNRELDFFLMLEWMDNVTDIRERFALLPLEKTLSIAKFLGISHPMDRKTKEYVILTTDFLVEYYESGKNWFVAYAICSEKSLQKGEVKRKLSIIKQYWLEKNIDFKIITERNIDKSLVKNINWIHGTKYMEHCPSITEFNFWYTKKYILRNLKSTEKSLMEFCRENDLYLNLMQGTTMWIFKHLLANKVIKTDMCRIIDPTKRFVIM